MTSPPVVEAEEPGEAPDTNPDQPGGSGDKSKAQEEFSWFGDKF